MAGEKGDGGKMGQSNRDEFKARRAARLKPQSGESANWGDVSGPDLANAIAWTAALGGALRCGYTRDGGAYAVGIYLDGEATTEYVRPSEDIDQWLRDLAADMKATYSKRGS